MNRANSFKFLNKFLHWIFLEKGDQFRLWIFFWIRHSWKKWHWFIFLIKFYFEMNEWIMYIESILSRFFIKKHPFCLFWILFEYFSDSDYWIEFSFELNFQSWIIVWIEFWVSTIEPNIKLNHFSAKLKHWIESDGLSRMAKLGGMVKYCMG